jgi:DNA-binding response OmpR family regulator
MKKMLIADDNENITSILEEHSKIEGYHPILAFDGREAIKKFNEDKPDVILLDVMMPYKNGFDVCKEIRRTSKVPILMITARHEDFDKIMGLDVGADDYIVKPFSPDEVMARVRAVMRRIDAPNDELIEIECHGLKINLKDYIVSSGLKIIDLTKLEFEVLWTLASNPSKVFTRDNLLDSVWGYDYCGDGRTVDKHIFRLREKLDRHGGKGFLVKTIRRLGYKFEVNPYVEK